jgi:hypothetical protein
MHEHNVLKSNYLLHHSLFSPSTNPQSWTVILLHSCIFVKFRFWIWERICNIFLSESGLFCLNKQNKDDDLQFHPFSWEQYNLFFMAEKYTIMCIYNLFPLPIHQLMGT